MPARRVTIRAADVLHLRKSLQHRTQLILDHQWQPKVFVVVNGKGGVGKSSVAAALAAAFAAIGKTVILMEMDEQGNNLEDLGKTGTSLDDGGRAQADAVLNGTLLIPTGEARPGLYIVPGGPALDEVVEELYVQRRIAAEMDEDTCDPDEKTAWMGMYAHAIDPLREQADIIVLDVAPGSSVLQLQALVAGDMVVVPSKSDPSSRKGLRIVATRFAQARVLNVWLKLLGVIRFSTNSSAGKVQKKIKAELEHDLGGVAPVFDTPIRHVEAAAVACRDKGLLPGELLRSDGVDHKLTPSLTGLNRDYNSLAHEVLAAWIVHVKEYQDQ